MKLLQIGPYPPPVGGWSFHIKVFKKYLDDANIQNEVLDIGENRRDKNRQCIDVQNSLDFVAKTFGYCLRNYKTYVHLNGNSVTGLLLTLVAQLISLLTFKRCFLSFHAGVIQSCFARGLTRQKLLALVSFHLADKIICNSEDVKKQIVKLGVSSQKVYPIPCFSIQYVNHIHTLTDEEKEFIGNHYPIISSYLFFRDEYDPKTLINALSIIKKKHPSFGAIVIGSIAGVEPYKQKIEQANLQDNIFLAGEKDHDNFLTIVESSQLVIRTPVGDGVCSSVMEAMALKIPVVASNNNTRPQEVILYDAGNAEDLAKKVTETLGRIEEIKKSLSGISSRDAIKEELEFLLKFS